MEPQGEAKSDSRIWSELAKRLGFGELFEYSTEEFLEMGLSSLEAEEVTLERLKEKGHLLFQLSRCRGMIINFDAERKI